MSACVGIDVHRKRSQVAVVNESGEVLANRNVPNGTETILGVIGGLPPGTPAASGTGWLAGLLEDYGFAPHLVHSLRCKAIASARGEERQGPAPRSWRSCSGRACCRRRGSPRRRCGSCGRCCATGWPWSGCGPCCATGSTRCWPGMVMTGRPGAGGGPGRAWLASLELPAASRELVSDDLGLTGALEIVTGRLDGEIHQRARAGPRVTVLTQLPGIGPFTALVILAEIGELSRFGSARPCDDTHRPPGAVGEQHLLDHVVARADILQAV
ncbi:MAG TPA: transposase, partial [Streptosporangiaceae bacterium]